MTDKFRAFPFQPFIHEALEKIGFIQPTEIQRKVIPLALKGESVIGQSQTGTGKTHAYLLPILEKIDPTIREVQAVITVPTRELAEQIYKEAIKITQYKTEDPIVVRRFMGGTDRTKDIEKLKDQPHIVIGTPGRILSLIKEQALFVHTAKMLVVDETDVMLDMGFIFEVDQIAGRMPEDLQMLVFSATIPENLQPFLKKYMENPEFIQIEPRKTPENNKHILVPLKSRNKLELLYEILQSLNPYLGLVFVNTKQKVDEITDWLIEKKINVGRLHGDISPRERKRVMKQIRNLEFHYVVATDLAARGIDIEGVSHVINFELPKDLQYYIHRAGRTARLGNDGVTITIYEPSDEIALQKLEKRGILFEYYDIKDGEWTPIVERHQRKNRKKTTSEEEVQVKVFIPKPKKIKPGYKKKMKEQQQQLIRRLKKQQRKKKR